MSSRNVRKSFKFKRYRLLPYITIIMLVTFLMILCNFPLFVYKFHSDAYRLETVTVEKTGYDGLFALIPKAEISYRYKGQPYTAEVLDYNNILYLGSSFGATIEVGVLESSPENVVYFHNYWGSLVNIIFFVVNIVCVVILVNNVRRLIPQNAERKYERTIKREARKRIKVDKTV